MGVAKLSDFKVVRRERGDGSPPSFIVSFPPNRAFSESLKNKKETRKERKQSLGSMAIFPERQSLGSMAIFPERQSLGSMAILSPRDRVSGPWRFCCLSDCLSICLIVCVWLSEWRLLDFLFLHTISRRFLNTRLPTHDSTPFPDLELFPSRLPHTLEPFPDDHFLIPPSLHTIPSNSPPAGGRRRS